MKSCTQQFNPLNIQTEMSGVILSECATLTNKIQQYQIGIVLFKKMGKCLVLDQYFLLKGF